MNSLKEQLSILGCSMLSESTLIKLIGDNAAGSNLARYMHRVHKVADQADWRAIKVDLKTEFDWVTFGSSANNLLLLKGSNGWAMIRPVKETFQASRHAVTDPDYPEDVASRTVVYEYYWTYGNKELSDEELTGSVQDLEGTRNKRFGNKETNKNVYTSFPFVEKTNGIVKVRERSPVKLVDDLERKLNSIESVWIADRREDTSKWKSWRQDYFDKTAGNSSAPDYWEKLFLAKQKGVSGYQGRAGKEMVPPGASIEMVKSAQRAAHKEEEKGVPITGTLGLDYLARAVEPLGDIIIRNAMIQIKRKFRNSENINDLNTMKALRNLRSFSGEFSWFLRQNALEPFRKKLLDPKNKKAQENLRLLVYKNNPIARKWFINLIVNEIISLTKP